jgi:hypothetical protein
MQNRKDAKKGNKSSSLSDIAALREYCDIAKAREKAVIQH